MNCREFIIEFEERGNLSEPAQLHLTVCADCQKASARQTNIWLLIDDFKPVAAPTDFDFHVKARIAKAKPSDFQKPAFLPILRYVLPLSVVVLVLGFFVFNSAYFFNAPNDSQSAQSETPAAKNDLPTSVSPANQLAFALSTNAAESPLPKDLSPDKMVVAPPQIDEKIIAGTTPFSRTRPDRKENTETAGLSSNQSANSSGKLTKDESGLGSHVLSGGNSAPVYFPKSVNPNQPKATALNGNQARPVSDEQTLDFFGIQTAFENGKRTVKSLTKEMSGERSGVKVGDIIEKVHGNSLTILRGIEKLEITLR